MDTIQNKINNSEKQFSILTVDDVPKNLQVLGTILRKEKYQVSFASSGKAALSILQTELPDLILLDIMMPEMDGYEVCEKLKSDKRTADIPIIFLTAKTETEDIIKGFETGAVDYVTKPFNVSELLARVNTHLELKESREKLIKLNATNSKFFSIMSKDIRNALIGVKGVAEFLIEDIESGNKDNISKMALLMYNDSTKLFNLLENLIEWSNINIGNIENKPSKFNPNDLVSDIYNKIEQKLITKNINFHNLVDENSSINFDTQILRTVLHDIINNSIKYSKEKGGDIWVKLNETDKEYTFEIQDNGIGMKEDRLKNLFLIDTPHEKTVGTANESGSGLGLLICKALIEKCDGKIWAESTYHKGTSVFFCLPK